MFRFALQKRTRKSVRLNITHVLTVFLHSSNHCLLYLIRQNHEKVKEERIFSFNRFLWPCIFPLIYVTLKSSHFPYANIQLSCRNLIQSMDLVANHMILWNSVTVNHTRYTSVLRVRVKQCWVSFETTAYCRELGLYYFQQIT